MEDIGLCSFSIHKNMPIERANRPLPILLHFYEIFLAILELDEVVQQFYDTHEMYLQQADIQEMYNNHPHIHIRQ
jgi:hypothetical protein